MVGEVTAHLLDDGLFTLAQLHSSFHEQLLGALCLATSGRY